MQFWFNILIEFGVKVKFLADTNSESEGAGVALLGGRVPFGLNKRA